MRLIELLIEGSNDRSLSPHRARQIDALQKRMDSYVDKIFDPATSPQGKEFLKSQLRDDYYELRDLLPSIHYVAEVDVPYSTANTVNKEAGLNRKGNINGGDQDGSTGFVEGPVTKKLAEAVRKLPLADKDFNLVKKIMERPIPAVIAPIYILEIIDDDELNDTLLELENSNPGMDVRPIIAEWFNRVMPDQLHRFTNNVADADQKNGRYSPVHGYDPKMYKGTNDPITGDAYGSR